MLGFVGDSKEKVCGYFSPTLLVLTTLQANSPSDHYHAIVTLISQAKAPNLLAQMPENFVAWF